MKKSIIIALMVVTANFSCRNNGTEPPSSDFQLIAEDVGVTEVWLRVKATARVEPRRLTLSCDGQTILSIDSPPLDTLILSDRLSPKHSYNYTATLTGKSFLLTYTAQLNVTTMDTTSHDFTWQIDTLGDGASTYLRDVFIINDTCVWAVGEIHTNETDRNDSAGHWVDPYNVAYWNGQIWELKRTFDQGFLYGSLYAVFAFNPNDVWVGSTIPEHWDGQKWTFYGTPRGFPGGFYINKIWGTNSNNIYIAGTGGSLVWSDGMRWETQNTGTTVNLTDVWGTTDNKEVWTCGWNDSDGRSVLLRLHKGALQTLWDRSVLTPPYIYRSFLSSLWSSGSGEFILTGGEVYRHSLINLNLVRDEYVKTDNGYRLLDLGNFSYRVRGNARNDIMLVGDDGMMWHWNGIRWHRYDQLHRPNDILYSVSVIKNMVVAVGTRYTNGPFSHALVIHGRR